MWRASDAIHHREGICCISFHCYCWLNSESFSICRMFLLIKLSSSNPLHQLIRGLRQHNHSWITATSCQETTWVLFKFSNSQQGICCFSFHCYCWLNSESFSICRMFLLIKLSSSDSLHQLIRGLRQHNHSWITATSCQETTWVLFKFSNSQHCGMIVLWILLTVWIFLSIFTGLLMIISQFTWVLEFIGGRASHRTEVNA